MEQEKKGDKYILHERILKPIMSKSRRTTFRKRRIGDFVAMRVGDKVAFGYTLCHKRDIYNFSENGTHIPNMGFERAKTRAVRWAKDHYIEVPPSIKKKAEKFITRCSRYFKGLPHQEIIEMEVVYPQDRVHERTCMNKNCQHVQHVDEAY